VMACVIMARTGLGIIIHAGS